MRPLVNRYGMGAKALADNARTNFGQDLDESEAAGIRNRYFEAYPGIRNWQQVQGRRLRPGRWRGRCRRRGCWCWRRGRRSRCRRLPGPRAWRVRSRKISGISVERLCQHCRGRSLIQELVLEKLKALVQVAIPCQRVSTPEELMVGDRFVHHYPYLNLSTLASIRQAETSDPRVGNSQFARGVFAPPAG